MNEENKQKKSKVRQRTFPVVFMLVITLVFISVTSVIYTFTKDTIELNATLLRKRSILTAGGLDVPEDARQVERLFSEQVEEVTQEGAQYYRILTPGSDQAASYVIVVQGPGLWGTIITAVGYDSDLEQLKGIEIIDQNETPGLGARIDEPWFKLQFAAKTPPLTTIAEEEQTGPQEVNAITGATYSTAAVMNIVNDIAEQRKQQIARLEGRN